LMRCQNARYVLAAASAYSVAAGCSSGWSVKRLGRSSSSATWHANHGASANRCAANWPGSTALQRYSARRGPYRLLYRIDEDQSVVLIERVDHHADACRR
jgi:hypothetical protein